MPGNREQVAAFLKLSVKDGDGAFPLRSWALRSAICLSLAVSRARSAATILVSGEAVGDWPLNLANEPRSPI
jgi:hypothetical protein